MAQRVTHIEEKMEEFASTFTEMMDSHNDRDEELLVIKSKLADVEDRSRRNNVKIRGIPESVKNQDLKPNY